MNKYKSLTFFIWFGTFFISFIAFNVAIVLCLTIFYNITQKQFSTTSKIISSNLNKAIIEIMNKEFKQGELKRFLKEFDGSNFSYPYKLEIYGINKDSKKFKWYGTDNLANKVFHTGHEFEEKNNTTVRHAYPIRLTEQCMGCHQKEKIGDVLAVLTITYDLKPFLSDFNNKMLYYFLILFPLPIIFAYFISRYISKKLQNKFDRLTSIVENVNSVKDLKRIETEHMDFGFKEFDEVASSINLLAKKVKDVAVDKEILQFEIKIMEKFIITSEVIKDWKENVKNILYEVNNLLEAYTIFSLFKVEEEVFSMEIFWIKKPSINTIELTERFIKEKIKESSNIFNTITELRMEHNIVNNSEYLKELTEDDIAIQTKALILDAPRIGGVVGIGVQSNIAKDNVYGIIIEGVLATLMNVVGSVKAISRYTKQLEYYTTRDPLTNLFNQRVFWELLGYEVGRAARHNYKFAILLIDIDNFKSVNDTYSHAVGDYIISEIALLIRHCLRRGDILARYSGDQFVAILPETGEEQGYLVAERIQKTIAGTLFKSSENSQIRVTVSIGISIFPDHADNAKDIFIFADNVLKRAKEEGRGKIVLPTQKEIFEVFKAISDKTILITKAVNEHKIIPFFQPIINNSNGKIECCEVLSRLQTPDGFMSAYEFIEIAEKINVISRLDIILLENAIIETIKSNFKGMLFINLSPRSLVMSEFIPEVLRITRDYGVENSRIIFEITERETVKNLSLVEKFIANLKNEGFKFAIDDFGSGFCSFQYLRRFPVNFLKIDGEFVRNILSDNKDMILVKTLVMIAKEYGIQTVAEYVENEQLFHEVRKIGIDYSQGYFIGKPIAYLP